MTVREQKMVPMPGKLGEPAYAERASSFALCGFAASLGFLALFIAGVL